MTFQRSKPRCFFKVSFYSEVRFGKFVDSNFYRFYLEITLFCTTPSGQIISYHVTDVKTGRRFGLYHHNTFALWIPWVSGILLIWIPCKVEMLAWPRRQSGYKSRHLKENNWSFLHDWLSIYQAKHCGGGGGGGRVDWISEEGCNGCSIL